MKKNILIMLFLASVTLVFGQAEDYRLKGIEEEIEQWIKKYNAVGLSISIVENDQIIYNKGFGYRDLNTKKPVDENTVFPIASCTKAFTATLLGILEAEDKVSLQDKPSLHIPRLQFYTTEMDNSINISDLLSHKSGLGNINGALVLFPENNRLKVLDKLKYIKPEGKVKESSLYSNMGFTIAGTIVEQITNHSWEDNIKNRIFEPLEMTNSFIDLAKSKETKNFSFGYGLFQNNIQKVQFEEYFDYKPAGGIRSTSSDMANWMLAWLNDGKFKDAQIIPTDYVKKARRFYNDRPNDYDSSVFLQGYGLGWRVESNDGDFKVYHGGNTSGFSTLVLTIPFKRLGITVLTNQDDSVLPYIIADIIKNRMLGKKAITDYPVIVHDVYHPDELKKSLNTEKKPTHSLVSFTGSYHHKGYGKIKVLLDEGNLYIIYPNYKFFLEHKYHNIFVMKPLEDISDILNPEFSVNFKTDNSGEISSLTMRLQSEPVEFKKQTEK